MKNVAEVPSESLPNEGDARETDKEVYAGEVSEVFDVLAKRRLTPKEVDSLKGHLFWPIIIDEERNIHGLPADVLEKDVIVFKGSDGGWWAQNPTAELLEEKRRWRHDWNQVGANEVRRDDKDK